jgi:two-component system, NtrC family, response regulator AtoC
MMQSVTNGRTICIAEDDPEVRSYLETALVCQGYSVEALQDGEELLAYLQYGYPKVSAVLLDLIMPRKDGMETLRELRVTHKDLPVVMISGASSPLNVVEAMRNGATNFLGKPVSPEDLRNALERTIEEKAQPRPVASEKLLSQSPKEAFLSANPQMQEIEAVIDPVGWSEAPVLIQGETGVGKEVLARALHARSPRAAKPFIKLNCAALPSELVESELFGYERGAFTGAFQKKPGMFELADGGTLLLDEIGDMDYKLQAKLLQVLQDQAFHRLGGKDTVRVDVRIMAATHNDLEKAILAGSFREDLYYRLNIINFWLPPLRERKEDILPLAAALLAKHVVAGTPVPAISLSLGQSLLAYDWPGNIREVENLMRKLIVLRNPDLIAEELRGKVARRALSQTMRAQSQQVRVAEPILQQVTKAKQHAESEAILTALNATRWNRKQAASQLNIEYKALLYKMKKLRIDEEVTSCRPKFAAHGA